MEEHERIDKIREYKRKLNRRLKKEQLKRGLDRVQKSDEYKPIDWSICGWCDAGNKKHGDTGRCLKCLENPVYVKPM